MVKFQQKWCAYYHKNFVAIRVAFFNNAIITFLNTHTRHKQFRACPILFFFLTNSVFIIADVGYLFIYSTHHEFCKAPKYFKFTRVIYNSRKFPLHSFRVDCWSNFELSDFHIHCHFPTFLRCIFNFKNFHFLITFFFFLPKLILSCKAVSEYVKLVLFWVYRHVGWSVICEDIKSGRLSPLKHIENRKKK